MNENYFYNLITDRVEKVGDRDDPSYCQFPTVGAVITEMIICFKNQIKDLSRRLIKIQTQSQEIKNEGPRNFVKFFSDSPSDKTIECYLAFDIDDKIISTMKNHKLH